jgi:hypothetical protein
VRKRTISDLMIVSLKKSDTIGTQLVSKTIQPCFKLRSSRRLIFLLLTRDDLKCNRDVTGDSSVTNW